MIDKDNNLAKRILVFYINKRLKSSLKQHKLHKEFKDIHKLAKKITSKPKPIEQPMKAIQPFQPPQEYQPTQLPKLEPLPEPTLKQPSPQLIHKKYPIITTSQFTLSTADISDTYQLHEPKLSPIEKNILQDLKLSLKDLIQKNPYKVTHHNFLEKRIKKLLKKNKLTISEENIHKLKYYLIRDSVG